MRVLLGDRVQSPTKGLLLGCVIPALAVVANSRNLGTAFSEAVSKCGEQG